MGVGVYESNFNGMGLTYIVDGTIPLMEEAYQDYLNDYGDQDPLPYEVWAEDSEADYRETLIETVQSACESFFREVQEVLNTGNFSSGKPLKLPEMGTREKGWCDFDSEFRLLFDFDSDIQVGLRGWESDYILGLALKNDPENMSDEIVFERGICAEDYKDQKVTMVQKLGAYINCSLLDRSFDVRYKTSGYTTSPYSKEGLEEQKKLAVESFADIFAALQRPMNEVLAFNFRTAPHSLGRLLKSDLAYGQEWDYDWYADHVNYVVYGTESNQVLVLDRDFEVMEETGIEVEPSRLSEASGEYAALSYEDEDNLILIADLQRKTENILITPQAYKEAFETDLFGKIAEYQEDDKHSLK